MKTFKKILVLLLAFVMVLAMVSCGAKNEEGEDTSLSSVIERGTLRIAAEGNWTPYVYNDPETGELMGFEVEMAAEIAKRIGVEVDETPADNWDAAIAGLDTGAYDVLICGAGPTPARKEIYEVGNPYGEQVVGLAVKADDDSIQEWADLEGKTSANSLTSSSGKIAQSYGAELVEASLDEAMMLIQRGDADCQVNDVAALTTYIKAHPDCGIEVRLIYQPENLYEIQSAPILPKGSVALCEKINEVVAEIIADGTAKELCIKYFGEDFANGVTLY